MSRLPNQPGELINRLNVIRFTFDGKPVEAYEGDTVGSALYAAGRRTFSRSFKYHRRRGLLCCAGQCPNCIVAVDGAPGVRACTEPVREGMRVEHLNAQPGLELDVMRATDIVGGPFTPPGFYYKTFIRPRKLWPLYEKVLRHAAGLGVLRKQQPEREWRTEYRRRHADVLVVGGGSAGRRGRGRRRRAGRGRRAGRRGAASDRADRRRRDPRSGERARLLRRDGPGLAGRHAAPDPRPPPRVRHRRDRAAAGVRRQRPSRSHAVRRRAPLDPALRGAARHPRRGRHDLGPRTRGRGELADAGVQIAAVADLRETRSAAAAQLRERGIEVLAGHAILAAKGGKAVEAAVLGPIGVEGASVEQTFDCDLVVVSGGFAPATSLPLQAGARTRYDAARGCFVLDELPPGVSAVGDVAGVDEAAGDDDAGTVAVPPPVSGAGHGKCFACLCEDVTAKDIKLSVEEGYDSIELSKRYTTVTMGPCQGRMCQLPAIRLMAKETGQSLEEVGTTTARPPWVSVPMGILAGRPFEPAKRSSIHGRHRELGANVKWAGDWRRAYDYGDPQAEALAVHQAAGLIDVSTLGKLLVRGPDAGEFLDRLYPNRFSDLKAGRIRYGVISSDAGRIVDDGTICRIDEDTFYVTTTSSGAGAVEEWFSWWLADWRMRVQLTDLTQGLSAVNLAGPRAREILGELTELDCSPEAFKYLDGKQAKVAGVPCLILRIGFVGEVGYEIHFAAAYGEHVWDALMAAGRDKGIRPFGLEPQRILRLQKMHILVGQDTDSESTPFGAAMPWIVKLDKEADFIGKWALEHYSEEEPATRLVGFTLSNGHVPTEGSVILDGLGDPAGQVTSARFSPVLDRVIGMAWVPGTLAQDGARVTISDEGTTMQAEVQTRPFYDPDGEVLRS